ncbi:MAG TPA: hypothetical protein ENL19_03645 [candidate division WOR-3 bacterium]|uniref:Peptidase C45 hydrolase domain-containing protein n=1 Tax=candidate division WOR-3 bacterium TaxID=2052148 RepID=A0A7C5DBC7_UNCW3|nr:hypothetical protein [candidate division WOR-3 bacterium]
MRKNLICLVIVLTILFPLFAGEECSTAIISGEASYNGAPLLWKNRDTGHILNKVIYVKEVPYNYIAIVNHNETSGRSVFAGINSAGFAIMNSVAYNLPKKSGERTDLEGIIMADALRKCRTVDDFENYIKANLGPGLGSQANFGVIDSEGNAALFEVYNHGYKRLDATDFPEKYIVNTNFSRSGAPLKGYGYIRFTRVTQLLKKEKGISPYYILQTVARDVSNALVPIPPRSQWKLLDPSRPFWVYTTDSINRPSTASAVVFQGVRKNQDPSNSIMWVILGEPVTSIAIPLWVKAGKVPELLWKGEIAPIDREAMRLKNILRPLKGGNRSEYIDLTKLDNRKGTGWLPVILKTEQEIFRQTAEFTKVSRSPEELAEFQEKIAVKVYKTLKSLGKKDK